VENVVRNGGALMAAELREAPDVVARQSELLVRPLGELAATLKRRPPRVVVTCARGSSGHAANFGKHLIERHLGIPVAAVAPSIMAIYRQGLRLKRQLFLAISQSGRSGAEFQHGPIALVSRSYPVLVFMPTDEAAANLADLAADVSRRSDSVFVTGAGAGHLPVLPPDQSETDAVCLIQSFYGLAVRVAEYRGIDVDQPRHLQKITRTR
jgi:fructoselysine-6-P-deglycase FrlB-like protein